MSVRSIDRVGQSNSELLDRLKQRRAEYEQAANASFAPLVPTATGVAIGGAVGVASGLAIGGGLGFAADLADMFASSISPLGATGSSARRGALIGAVALGAIGGFIANRIADQHHADAVAEARRSLVEVDEVIAELGS